MCTIDLIRPVVSEVFPSSGHCHSRRVVTRLSKTFPKSQAENLLVQGQRRWRDQRSIEKEWPGREIHSGEMRKCNSSLAQFIIRRLTATNHKSPNNLSQ